MPLAAQCRKVRDIYRSPGTGAPQKSEKMRYLKNEGRVLWALWKIFGGNDPILAQFVRGGYCLQ